MNETVLRTDLTRQSAEQATLRDRHEPHCARQSWQGNVSSAGDPFEGLTGQESNPDTSGTPVPIFKINPADPGCYFMPGGDPCEGFANTNSQLFGVGNSPAASAATNQGFVTNFDATIAYDQRVGRSVRAGTTASSIMGVFTPQALPVLSGLARGFAVCDHWFALAPTETFPNRAFACAATSQGHMNDGTASYTVGSIFGLLTRKNFPDTTPTGFPRSPETRPDPGALCVPGAAAPTRPGVVPGRRPPLHNSKPLFTPAGQPAPGYGGDETSDEGSLTFTHVHSRSPSPAFPSPVAPRRSGSPFGFPWASHPDRAGPAPRTPGQGQAPGTTWTTHPASAEPPHAVTHSVRPRRNRHPPPYKAGLRPTIPPGGHVSDPSPWSPHGLGGGCRVTDSLPAGPS